MNIKISLLLLAVFVVMAKSDTSATDAVNNKINRFGFLSRPVGARMLSSRMPSTFQRMLAASPQDVTIMNNQNMKPVQVGQPSRAQMMTSQMPTQNMMTTQQQPQQMMMMTNNQQQPQMMQQQNGQIMNNQQQMQSNQTMMTNQPPFMSNQMNQMNQMPRMNQMGQPMPTMNQMGPMGQMQNPPMMNQMGKMQTQPMMMNQMQNKPMMNQMPNQQMMMNPMNQMNQQPPQQNFCSNAQMGSLIPHPSNQTQFIICYTDDQFTVMDCPEHLIFNRFLQRCDHDEQQSSLCQTMPCKNNGKCIDILDKSTYVCECPNGFTGQNCESANTCASKNCGTPDGVCVELGAGAPIPNICKCNNGASFGPTCTQNLEMNPCFQSNSNSVKFPTRLDPSVFVHCQGRKPHFMFCQHGLVFSMSRQVCDWNSN